MFTMAPNPCNRDQVETCPCKRYRSYPEDAKTEWVEVSVVTSEGHTISVREPYLVGGPERYTDVLAKAQKRAEHLAGLSK